MLKVKYTITLALFLISLNLFASDKTPPLQGEITASGEPVPFATVQLKSSTIGSASNLDGRFFFEELPEGEHTLVIKSVGHKTKEVTIHFSEAIPLNIDINLEEDVLGLEQVVVTADKTQKKRIDASMIVNTMTPKQLTQVQAVTLSEGLNYTTGLRMENNCQNCGANQVRMNGMEGSYSQILVNGRPIFSGLASVYGLEMIPANMIQQIEVVKGGGSALYGSNAIAGTINLITKEAVSNSYEASINSGIIGIDENPSHDLNINLNASLVSKSKNTGANIYATHRNREAYDANDDTFTELAEINNYTIGTSIYQRFGYRNKITLDYFHIEEDRRGGDMLDVPEHLANIAESVEHNINTGGINFTRFVGENSGQLSVYGSAQHVDRWTYYGARSYEDGYIFTRPMDDPDQLLDGTPDLSAYGETEDFSYSYGAQFKGGVGRHSYITGIENVGSNLKDKKLAYTDHDGTFYNEVTISDQNVNTWGAFGQYDYEMLKVTLSAGVRVDHYNIKNNEEDGHADLSNTVVSPRLNLLYKPTEHLQLRGSYSNGYRAPQIFDEDLHIEIAGNRKVVHENGDNLKQETSNSLMASLDYQTQIGSAEFEFMAEGFYTHLTDAFANEQSEPDEQGVVTYTRVNGGDAVVKGINLEARYYPSTKWNIDLGYTIQTSEYDEAQESGVGNFTKKFLRTPNQYGYFTFNADPFNNFTLSLNGTYCGSMKLEYFGPDAAYVEDNNGDVILQGEFRDSKDFFDVGIKGEYIIKAAKGFDISLNAGLRNIFNSYQDDFDSGINRDPGYIYGPGLPRSIYVGVKIGNLL
ncbi:TonB-dependent receptor [Saccharicrinis sp. 156]|uniref:TonB-dependent receptor n=1 Tax=Saccharicrinis sp. 156 TaxID=3417574 RepID=UPI003D349F8B